jgi:hypothetical protein
MTSDESFDALLSDILAPPSGAADSAFAVRAQAAVAEAERFRRWRRRALRQVASEARMLAGLAGAAITIVQVPLIGEMLSGVPLAAPALIGALLLTWLALGQTRGGPALA